MHSLWQWRSDAATCGHDVQSVLKKDQKFQSTIWSSAGTLCTAAIELMPLKFEDLAMLVEGLPRLQAILSSRHSVATTLCITWSIIPRWVILRGVISRIFPVDMSLTLHQQLLTCWQKHWQGSEEPADNECCGHQVANFVHVSIWSDCKCIHT